MGLTIAGRHDGLLLGGFTVALLVIFQRGLQRAFDVAREIEQTYDIALVPALIILTVMFVFHQHAKRRELKAEAASSAREAAAARTRAEDLERLMRFGQGLAHARSMDAIRETVWTHLPMLLPSGDTWVLLRVDNGWDRLTDMTGARWAPGSLECIAELALAEPVDDAGHDGVVVADHATFVILAGTTVLGVLGLLARDHNLDSRRKAGAAAALLGVAIRNAQLFVEIQETSFKDDLTGCFNRAHAFEVLDAELARARRAHASLSVLMFDIDQFKGINDTHGHAGGDTVLEAIGQRLRNVLRKSDVRCRYGGDEFLVVLPETNEAGALRVAEWLRVEMEQIEVPASARGAVTISVGVASVVGGDLTSAAFVDRADRALYQAKAAGRNCVRVLAPPVRTQAIQPVRLAAARAH